MNITRNHKSPFQTRARRVILIDIENANGRAIGTLAQAKWCHRVLTAAIQFCSGDQVVIACNGDAQSMVNTYLTWGPSPRLIPGYGRDGADKALLAVMDENLECRFDELVLVTGDGVFADRVAELAAVELPTHVFAHPTGLAARLRLAATSVSPIITNRTPMSSWKQGA